MAEARCLEMSDDLTVGCMRTKGRVCLERGIALEKKGQRMMTD